ncbi:MAG: PAS domain-containing sensor histidine kinase [Deltaproteobacteria bacterium]|nr:MAG: PAS domain-containing sensor histidine kinase [Deltaproteobacteria bacterium]
MPMRNNSGKFPFYLILIFFFLSLGILTTGYLYYKNQEVYIKREKQQELAAIIALKIDQIISWRQERLDYAGTIMDDPVFARRVSEFMTGRPRPALREQILERLTALASYQFNSLALIDPKGVVRLAAPDKRQELNPYLKSLAGEATRAQKIVFSDLYRDEDSKVMLSVLTPILVIRGDEKITVGVILMKIEPYQFLYPLIKSWPTPSRTGETELIRREADEVVFLNELRHQENIPLNLRFPLDTPQLLAARVARGKKGVVEGPDYRGVPVLGVAGRIPDSPWLLIAKVDAEEIYAPLRHRSQEVALFLFILIGTSGISVAYFWRNQQSRFYRRQYEMERERRALAQRYEYLTRFANDIILVTDENLRIVEANDQAVAAYGYAREALLQLHLIDLYPPGSEQVLETLIRHGEGERGLIFEAPQQREDGTTFPAEISLRLLEIEGEKLFQEIIRDITKRKQTEEVLKKSEKNLHHLASQLLTAQEDERKRISRELHDELGHSLLALNLQIQSVSEQLLPRQEFLKTEMEKILKSMGATIEGVRRLYLDLTPGDLEDLGLTTALRSLVEDFADLQKHIKWSIRLANVDGLFPLPVQTAIYRVVQEALTNIGKHASPRQVRLEIAREKQAVSFAIEDDGQGFEPHRMADEKKTLGLLAMKERVKILGGSFDLWSEKNKGTRISFTIPISGGR